MNEDNYKKLVIEAIEFYKSSKKENIDEILLDFLNNQKVTENEEESKNLILHISSTIDNVSDNYDNLKIKRTDEKQPEQPYDIIREKLQNVLKNTHDNEQKNISEMLVNEINNISKNTDNNEYNLLDSPVEYSKELTKNINSLIALDVKVLEELDSETSNVLSEDNEILDFNDFYNSEFNSKEEKNIKKTLSVANYVAIKKKFIKLPQTEIDEKEIEDSIPYIIDKNLSQSKIYYKYGKKEISFDRAFDELIDRYTAILITVIENKSVVIGQNLGAQFGSFVGSIFGPVGTSIGFELGRVVGKAAGETVGKIISNGIKELSSIFKNVIKETVETIYNKVKNIYENLFA